MSKMLPTNIFFLATIFIFSFQSKLRSSDVVNEETTHNEKLAKNLDEH